MSRYSLNPDRLFDRPWRPGHPFHPKTGRVRRIGMGVLFVLLTVIIWGYGYITDSKRVRAMAQDYLSSLIGGRVTVGSATLSVFEGLRLDDVRVFVDMDDDPALPPRPDGLVFTARTFIVQYNPRTMVSGQLEAQQIVAEKPQVHLTHDALSNRWNFNRLGKTNRPAPPIAPGPPPEPPKLPELLLRNARVEIHELRNGVRENLGYMALDGHLNPLALAGGRRDDYGFSVQSRGITDDLGPSVTGKFNISTGAMTAKLDFFELGNDVFKMLPDKILPVEVNQLLTRLNLKGRIDIPEMSYTPPATPQADPQFSVEMDLRDVSFSIPPNQWATSADAKHRTDAMGAADIMTRAYVGGGFAVQPGDRSSTGPKDLSARLEAGVPKAMTWLAAEASAPPIEFKNVNGKFAFTHQGIQIKKLEGNVEDNALVINGSIDGYGPDAPLAIHIGTAKELNVPAVPRYLQSLPPPVREIYEKTRPQGTCQLAFDLKRSVEGGPIVASGAVDLVNAQFLFDDFKYPVRETHGRVEFGRDDQGYDWLALKAIQGRGVPDGPNADRFISVNGYLGPLNVPGKEPGGLLNIDGKDLTSEPALFQAFDRDVREALAIFDAPGKGKFPTFNGDVHCEVFKAFGDSGPLRVRLVDLNLKTASARMVGFPYPLQNVNGHVQVRDGYADIDYLNLAIPGGSGKVSGRVAWEIPGRKLPDELAKRKTDLAITVAAMKVDEDLLSALPADAAAWIRKMDVRGKLDANGRLTGGEGGKPIGDDPDLPLNFDLDLALHDATVHPQDSSFEVAGATGRLHLVPGRLDLLDLRGTHAGAGLSLVGQVKWANQHTTIALVGKGEDLILDSDLLSLVPTAAKSAWAEVQPRGTVDAEVTFAGESSDAESATRPVFTRPADVTVVDLTRPATLQTTRPSALVLDLPASPGRPPIRREIADGLNGTIRPRSLAITLKSLAYELREVTGEVLFGPEQVELRRVAARHGKAELAIAGIGRVSDSPQWDLKVSAKNVAIDDDLTQSLPETLRKGIAAIHANGSIGLDLEHLIYRGVAGSGVDGKPRDPALNIEGKLLLEDVGLDAGVTVKNARGAIPLSVAVRGATLQTLGGSVDIASLNLAGRTVTDLRGEISKVADRREVVCSKLRASIGGGDLAGNITLIPPDGGPATYKLSLFLRNADVRDLTLETKEGLNGRATASLDIEGAWGQGNVRRGRGDVSVTGHDMARLPLLLGLMQVTNLSLPISSPLSQATARYSVDNETVNFERIELRSDNMLMSGSGKLDFGTRQVQMVFVTDNPGGFKIPFLGDLWRGAQQELVHIQVRGTVQDPKVENRPLGTFTTTVDQVFRGDAPKKKK